MPCNRFSDSYYGTGRGVEEDHKQAARWFRKAADKGNAEAMFLLGAMYALGDGVPQDGKEAIRWYRLAADKGNPRAREALQQLDAWVPSTEERKSRDGQ